MRRNKLTAAQIHELRVNLGFLGMDKGLVEDAIKCAVAVILPESDTMRTKVAYTFKPTKNGLCPANCPMYFHCPWVGYSKEYKGFSRDTPGKDCPWYPETKEK